MRNFPQSVADLRKRLKLKDGGDKYVFATTLLDGSHALVVDHSGLACLEVVRDIRDLVKVLRYVNLYAKLRHLRRMDRQLRTQRFRLSMVGRGHLRLRTLYIDRAAARNFVFFRGRSSCRFLRSRLLALFLFHCSIRLFYFYIFPRHQHIKQALKLAFDLLYTAHNISSFHLNSY
ncbi:THUMP-like domain-containing protein [Mitsuokella sp.]|uniref:THUMP-like domain-containing protein n=1 Tax=Mitsuokella sp. TaxID=2049034 RepID=UPI003D7D0626